MDGPYPFTSAGIRAVQDPAFGVYALVDVEHGVFVTAYVGRGDVKARLRSHLGDRVGASHFFVLRTDSSKQAFLKECSLFHRYGKRTHLLNKYHPAREAGDTGVPCSRKTCNGEHD